ncbi:hypothetical protein BJX66DRAFT_344754 [Aspergillus keveii]|uniref:Uncharacterized protein n=1 Tax=Aspergillus keveii TaxID=714993 RepID=A0ABR4FK82_9EURO
MPGNTITLILPAFLLLLQVCGTAAAPNGEPHGSDILPPWVGGINNGNDNNSGGSGGNFNNNHGGDNSGNSGNSNSNSNSDDDSIVNTCANIPTSTVTITTGGGSCTASMFMTVTDCTSSTTDYVTVTDDGPTITTAGPVSTVTTTITTGAETVTEPGLIETVTSSATVTDTTTVTDHEIETTTITSTATMTLQITTTVTGDDCEVTNPTIPGYGSCGDPTIVWLYGLDGRTDYSYTTTNQVDFPFGSSPSIDPVTALICNRLRSPCNAPDEVVDRCWEAAAIANQFEGQEAADVWNELMT